MKKTRIYLIASYSCPACINAIMSLGIVDNKLKIDDDTTLHLVYPKDNQKVFKRLQIETTPSYAFMKVEDINNNGVFEGIEETHIKTYNGFIGLEGLKEIVEQIKLGNILETDF